MARQKRSKRWSNAILIAGAALTITVLLQQPAQSPAPNNPSRQANPVHQSRAEKVAETARKSPAVADAQVAVRDGTAIIAIKPQSGLSERQLRSVERQLADGIPSQVEGISHTLVTTDPNVYARVQQLQNDLVEAERRVGPRMTEANLQWGDEFEDVLRVVRGLPNHARGTAPGARAGAAANPEAIDGSLTPD